MSNLEREFAEKMRTEGWDVTKRGWPDFICRRNGELMAVEVKGPHDGLSHQQWEAIRDLRASGIPTFVWGADTGFVEVGGPVGESVHSLRATIAQLRRIIADMKAPPPQPVPQGTVTWTYQEDDPESVQWMKQECLRTHTAHWERKLGTSGSFCSDLAILARRYSAEEIMQIGGLTSLGHTRRNLDSIRSKMIAFQHSRLHGGLQPTQRCTSCPSVEQAA